MNDRVAKDRFAALKELVYRRLEADPRMGDDELKAVIDGFVFGDGPDGYVPAEERIRLAERLFHAFRGLDVLQPLVDDPSVTEVMINGAKDIFIERGHGIERADVEIESEDKLLDLIQIMVGKVNRAVNEANPIVDARLPDGSRVHVVLPPVALGGPTVTIRKFPANPYTLDELIRLGLMGEDAGDLLRRLVKARYNLFIAGGTGSGKTTLLNALAQHIDPWERVITIEDSAELKIRGIANLVGLETRNANAEGKGKIDMRDLIRASLRMRPDRIIVGEVRGPEAYDMLQAMNTGHEGSLSTGHGNSVKDMLYRLETMVLLAVHIPLEAIRRQICSALDVIIHLSRHRDGVRRVGEISELVDLENGDIRLNPLFVLDRTPGGRMRLVPTGNPMRRAGKLAKAGLA
jgi:pilus assembly protein CpaF